VKKYGIIIMLHILRFITFFKKIEGDPPPTGVAQPSMIETADTAGKGQN
jgi:hypothetical protein